MARRTITCTNDSNISLILTDSCTPWMLEECEGIYEAKNNVSTSANTMTDGSTYQGSVALMRNIILTLRDRTDADHQANRSVLYALFKPKSLGTLIYSENDIQKQIYYYVESVHIDSIKRSRRATVSLLCPNPYFTDLSDTSVQMSGWNAGFEFQHEFIDGGEELGARVAELLKTIENNSAADDIGVTITMEASGTVTNPAVTIVEQGEYIKIGTNTMPFTMSAGDKLIITTHINNKHVYLVSDGVKNEINEYLSEDSEFLQLMSGDNTFGYSAKSGEDYLSVTISYRYHYLGV